jgi:trigger factor
MLLSYEELSPVRKVVEVEIPAAAVDAELKKVTSEFARQARIPGFRPGKTPVSVVRSRFSKDIQEETMNRLLPESFREAVREKNVEPVGDPRLQHVDQLVEGKPLKYKAEFEIKPAIELQNYRGIEVTEVPIEVTDEDVDSMIERFREQASSYRPVEDRGAEKGDFVMIDMAHSGEGIETKTESGHIQIGEQTPLPELHDAIRGKKAGEQVSFEKTYGEDAANEAFRGKTVKHDVTVKEVRVQEKPEVTDDFARSLGSFESVAGMRDRIREDIRRHREAEVLRAKRQQIGDRLLSTHNFEVPDSLVQDELAKSLQNYARYLVSQGVDLDKAKIDWEKMRADFHPEAVKRVKRGLILEAIARKEGIAATDVEVDAEIRRAAIENKREFADVKQRLRHDGGYEALRLSLSQEKALEFVLAQTTPARAP